MQETNGNYFCFLPVTTSTEFIIYIVLTLLSLPLAFIGVKKFCKMRGSHNHSTTFVYIMLLLWWLSFLLSNAYSMGLFYLHDNDQQAYDNQTMSDYSKYNFVLDWVCTFILQLLFLYVPYRWCKNITTLFNGGGQNKSNRDSDVMVTKKYTGIETKIYPSLKIYIGIRFLELGLPVVLLFMDYIKVVFKIMMAALIADCLIVTLALLFGVVSLKVSQELKESLDQEQSKRMFNQYLLIMTASIIRFAFDTWIVVSGFQDSSFTSQCPSEHSQPFIYIIFLFAICILADFFPIFLILRIYTLEEKAQELCKSLIISTNLTNDAIRLKD